MLRSLSRISAPSALCALLLLWGAGCGASINPAYKADIDRRVAGLHGVGANYPASDAIEPLPLAVGQWVQLKVVDGKQRPGFVTYKIVGQEGDAYWVETINETYSGKLETRMLIDMGDRKTPERVQVRAFKTRRNDEKVQDYPSNMLGLLKSAWKPIVSSMVIGWTDLPREDTRVVAGDFAGCYKRRSTFSFGPYEQTSDGWMHPAVPINGLVRSVGVNKPITIELVAFGTEGAKSTF